MTAYMLLVFSSIYFNGNDITVTERFAGGNSYSLNSVPILFNNKEDCLRAMTDPISNKPKATAICVSVEAVAVSGSMQAAPDGK